MLTDLPEEFRNDPKLGALARFYFNEEVREGEQITRPILPDSRLPGSIRGAATRLVTYSSRPEIATTLTCGLQTINSAVRTWPAYRDWNVFTHVVNDDVGMVGIFPASGALHGDGLRTVFWVVRYRRG